MGESATKSESEVQRLCSLSPSRPSEGEEAAKSDAGSPLLHAPLDPLLQEPLHPLARLQTTHPPPHALGKLDTSRLDSLHLFGDEIFKLR